jgi:hypothetical protein
MKLEDKILIDALAALEDGEPIEQIVARYPNEAEELRSALATAANLSNLKLAPSAAAKAESRRAFLTQAAAMRERPMAAAGVGGFWRGLRRLLAPVAVVAVVVIMGLYILTQNALPGQPLYGAKLELESSRLARQSDPDALTRLNEAFEERRRQEVETLLRRGREADVMFGDQLAQLQDNIWQLESGIEVRVAQETVVRGTPLVGAYVHVIGRTNVDGTVHAGTVRVDAPLLPAEEEAPVVTPTPYAADTPSATSTPELPPDSTSTTTPTVTPTATPSATPTSTATPTDEPTVTATPTDDDPYDDDGGSDTGDDDGSGSDDPGDDSEDGNGGPGSGDDDGESDGDDNSGPGSGEDGDDSDDENSSGPGSGDDGG